LAERGVDVLAPVPQGAVADEGRLGKQDFQIDMTASTITCPAGHTVKVSTSTAGARSASFPRAACGSCPLKNACCPGRPHRQVNLGEHEEHLQAARATLADPTTAEHLRRTRPRIERLVGLIAHRYGARKSRYIGRKKARLQAAWAAALVNLNPIARHLAAKTA
jgi:hypothetical protein